MRHVIVIALMCAVNAATISSVVHGQATGHLQSVVANGDSGAIRIAVHDEPTAARDLLSDLRSRSVHALSAEESDSVLKISLRLASAYATAWSDSFPLTNLQRFTKLPIEQRRAVVTADSLRLAGNSTYARSGPLAAIRLWRKALRRSVEVSDTAGAAASLGNIGAAFYRLMQFDSARRYLERAKEFSIVVGDQRTSANALGTLASIAKDRGAFREAEDGYRRTLTLRSRIGDLTGESADHNNLGLIASALGDSAEARTQFTTALRIARDHGLEDAAATALLNLGNLATFEVDYAKATVDYRDALAAFRELGSDADAALALQNLGRLATRTGDYSIARDRLREALVLFERAGTREDIVQTRRDLAAVASASGDLRTALEQLRSAQLVLKRGPGLSALEAAVALARGDILLQLNDYPAAETQYDRALALARRVGDVAGETNAREGQAVLLLKHEQYFRAENQLERVAHAQRASGDRRASALTELVLGWAREQRGDTTTARLIMNRSRDSLRALNDPIGEASALVSLGDLESDARLPLAAEKDYRRGLALITGLSAPAVSWRLHDGLAHALQSKGLASAAITELRSAIAEVERMATSLGGPTRRSIFLSDKWQPYEELALLEHDVGTSEGAFAASERMHARQLLELFARGGVARPPSADSDLVRDEQNLRREIAELTQRLETHSATAVSVRGPDDGDAGSAIIREALAHDQERYQQLLVAMEDQGARKEPPADVSSWRTVADRLGADEAMLEYLVTDSTTLLFVVRRDSVRSIDLGVGRKELLTLIDFARGIIGQTGHERNSTAWRAPLRRLYEELIAPADDAGLLSGVKQLVIVPHAELHYLPFAALIDGSRRNQFLVERYDLGYAPSASLWVQLSNRSPSTRSSVLAFAPRARTLPGSRDEVESIASLYGPAATVLSDRDATEQRFREIVGKYDMVHLATYGVLNQHNPLFSFVELSSDAANDGRLEVHEIFGLALHARLVLLSACKTGLASGIESDIPAGDDWVGLVHAFLSAGAEQVMATLWAVEDRSTAVLMKEVHQQLRAGESTRHALSQAQRAMLRNSSSSSPFYWAAFVDVGSGR